MKKITFLILLIFVYSVLYKLYLTSLSELFIYIINPLFWLLIAFISGVILPHKRTKKGENDITFYIVIIISLIYIICYYGFGIFVGYKNNPYSTTLSGIIVNFFSIILVVCSRETLRYFFLRTKIKKYEKLYYIILYIVFVFYDVNILSIIISTDFLLTWSKELFSPLMVNLLMMYLIYISDYKSSLASRIIILLPSIIFNVVPDNDWPIIIVFNITYIALIYFAVRYFKKNNEKSKVVYHSVKWNPRKIVFLSASFILLTSFGLGFWNIKPVVILSASMEPYISPGDMIIVRKKADSEIIVGDIIEYRLSDYDVIHRVIEIIYNDNKKLYITKGDANKEADRMPVDNSQIVGKYVFNIPFVGYPTYLIKNIVDNNEKVDIEQGGGNNE